MGAEHPCPLCLRVRHHIPKLPPPPPLSASPLLPWWCWGRPGGLVASGTRANSLAGCRDPVCECALVSPAEWERWGILGDHPRAGVTVAASPPWLKYGGWLLVCSQAAQPQEGGLGSRAGQRPGAAGGAWRRVTPPAPHSGVGGAPVREGGERQGCAWGTVTSVLPDISRRQVVLILLRDLFPCKEATFWGRILGGRLPVERNGGSCAG